MNEKICESCGMPMRTPAEFGGGNLENKYCVHCTYEDGALKPFELKKKEMADFIRSRMNIDEKAAEKLALESMAKQPAWKAYF